VATRSGTISVPALAAEAESSVIVVTFSDPMPDANYLIDFRNSSTKTNIGVNSKTKDGFRVYVKNVAASSEYAYSIDYTAFKIYDVADAETLYSTVQDIEAMIPASASSTNKFSTASDLRTETRALDRRLDDVEDVVPDSASISNKLVTQDDLDNATIEELGDIEDVDVSTVTDGQTIIWDATNSKWVNGQGGKTYTAGDGINISNTDEISAKVDDTSITTDTNDALKVADTYKTTFVGTQAQWDALSTSDKKKYQIANITDDVIGGEVADAITDGDGRPVTSNAVYDYPIDSITDGQHRPPTSNAVFDALAPLRQNTNGYFVLPNGLKICWGGVGGYASGTTSGPRITNYPITFTEKPRVFFSTKQGQNSSEVYVYDSIYDYANSTTSQLKSYHHWTVRGDTSSRGWSQDDYSYIAIGY
jgi:hypothetical protein